MLLVQSEGLGYDGREDQRWQSKHQHASRFQTDDPPAIDQVQSMLKCRLQNDL